MFGFNVIYIIQHCNYNKINIPLNHFHEGLQIQTEKKKHSTFNKLKNNVIIINKLLPNQF